MPQRGATTLLAAMGTMPLQAIQDETTGLRGAAMKTPGKSILLFWAIALPVAATAAHGPLLPRPQKISYGKGALPVVGLSIRFASPPSEEDFFAAKELAQAIEAETGERPPIVERELAGQAIVLMRT